MARYVSTPEKRTVVLAVELPAIGPELLARAEHDGFRLKDEFHITVVHPTAAKLLGDTGYRHFADKIGRLATMPNYALQPEVYHIVKSKTVDGVEYPRESLVVPVISPGIEADIAYCAEGYTRPQPFLHITLFTKHDNEHARTGIGIPTAAEWAALEPTRYAESWQA